MKHTQTRKILFFKNRVLMLYCYIYFKPIFLLYFLNSYRSPSAYGILGYLTLSFFIRKRGTLKKKKNKHTNMK